MASIRIQLIYEVRQTKCYTLFMLKLKSLINKTDEYANNPEKYLPQQK